MNVELEKTIKRLEEEVNKQAEIIQWYEKENKELSKMCELYSKSLYNADLKKAQQELDQYKNNWEELKKMFEADEHFEDGCYCGEILNKMKELEE